MNDFEPNKTPYSEDELADLLDALIPPDTDNHISEDEERDPLLEIAVRLANAPSVAPSSLMMARMQAQMLAANQAQQPQSRNVGKIINLFVRTSVAAVMALFVMGLLSTLVDYAVPGDPLYPIKRAFESSQIVFAEGAYDVAETRLIHAKNRIAEAELLLQRGEVDLKLIDQINKDILAAQVLAFNDDVGEQLNNVQFQLYRLIARANASNNTEVQTAFAFDKFYPVLSSRDFQTDDVQAVRPARPTSVNIAVESSLLFFTPENNTTDDASLSNFLIEGQVTDIDGNTLSIFNTDITLIEDDPLLDVVRVGDSVRIDGRVSTVADAGIQTLVSLDGFTLMDADGSSIALVLNAEHFEAWRDFGTCENPPPPWAMATDWRIRCRNITVSSN